MTNRRVSVVGLPGSGKSTLAEAISEKLSIPHIHLDRFWFEAGGNEAWKHGLEKDKEAVRAQIRDKILAAIAGDAWVSDGFFGRVQPEIATRAEVLIYLDVPLWRRLLNHAERVLKPNTRHKELSAWDEFIFFFEIVRRTSTRGPALKALTHTFKDKTVILRSRKEIEYYLRKLV